MNKSFQVNLKLHYTTRFVQVPWPCVVGNGSSIAAKVAHFGWCSTRSTQDITHASLVKICVNERECWHSIASYIKSNIKDVKGSHSLTGVQATAFFELMLSLCSTAIISTSAMPPCASCLLSLEKTLYSWHHDVAFMQARLWKAITSYSASQTHA